MTAFNFYEADLKMLKKGNLVSKRDICSAIKGWIYMTGGFYKNNETLRV
jgi:hypothetical protein